MTVAAPPTTWGPSLACAFTSNSGRRNSCTWNTCVCWLPGSAVPAASIWSTAAPRFIVGGSFRARSKPPRRLTRASPLPTSLPCESRSVHARPLTEAGSASTSPRGPAPSRRSQPLTRTSSPGRYIFRSSNTQKRSESVRAVFRQPAPSLHQPVSDGRIATSFPRRATSSGAGASPRASRARPEASERAEPGPPDGRPVPGRPGRPRRRRAAARRRGHSPTRRGSPGRRTRRARCGSPGPTPGPARGDAPSRASSVARRGSPGRARPRGPA